MLPYGPNRGLGSPVGKAGSRGAAEVFLSLGLPWAPIPMAPRMRRKTELQWCQVSFAPPWSFLCPTCPSVHCSRCHCSGDRTTSGAKITGMWQISLSPRLGQLTSELQLLQFLFPPAGAWEPVIYAHTCIFPGLWPRACLHPAKLKWMISKPDTHEYNPYLCENFHKPKLFTAIALAVPLIALAM